MGISERGEERIVTIYVDVLVALNLYVTWFLLLASEALSGRPCRRWRRGLAALAGGLSSLAIFLPELPFLPLFFIKLGLAAVITWIAGGRAGFWRRMGFFFAANFLFAGVIIALWLMAAPPRLIIRNGVVYYHIQAMTLAVSTVIAYAAAYAYGEVDDMLALAREKGEPPFLFLLDGIEDPHNLGAIIRTANLAGAHGVIIPKRRAVGLTATVAKTSAGALNYTPVARVTNLTQTMEELKKEGMWFVCADMGGETMYRLNLTGPIGLVIGNEGEGVSRLVKDHCDLTASIPMKGDIDSLNASVAAGVLAYEIVRQRLKIQ